ncbi:hypothetical protein LVR66_02100 [Klebsiella pneumoniae]|nr:hypothetical protein [Klebsiella pneumoniae]
MIVGLCNFDYQSYFTDDGLPLELSFEEIKTELLDVTVRCSGLPLLKEQKSGDIYFPDKSKMIIHYHVQEALKADERTIYIAPREDRKDKRYHFCEGFNFSYSSIDYEFIPGLYREWNDGFLTPVFFNISVLNKYSQSPDYILDLFSSTYGNITNKNDEWIISFGINKNKKVIMWLGDIDKLPEKEKYYLLSENVESDHSIHSEFYNAQIDVKWSDPSIENEVFELRKKISDKANYKHGHPMNKLEGEISNIISNLDKPVYWEDKHVSPIIESLNRVFIESLNVELFKASISKLENKIDIKNLKGLKLYSLWLKEYLRMDDSDKIMCPFFVLYDFRIMVCHLQSEQSKSEQLKSINKRLNIDEENCDYEIIYEKLFEQLKDSLTSIEDKI